jgi:hypothetical protein
MKKVPKGKLVTINGLREALAKKHEASIGCLMTTGIFACITANAAEEQKQNGIQDITTYWRTLKAGGILNPKYPGGVEGLKKLLEAKGHKIVQKGKKHVVTDYEEAFIEL